jgi:hypothetical protein
MIAMTDRYDVEGIQVTDLEQGDEKGVTQVIIQPGIEAPPIGGAKTVRLHVQDGSVRLWISDGTGYVQVKNGAAIQADGGAVYCEKDTRDLSLDTPVVLTARNSCFVENGVLHMSAVGDQPAELHVAAQERDGGQGAEREGLAVPQRADLGVAALAQTMQSKPSDDSGTSGDADDSGTSGGIRITPYACWVCPGWGK